MIVDVVVESEAVCLYVLCGLDKLNFSLMKYYVFDVRIENITFKVDFSRKLAGADTYRNKRKQLSAACSPDEHNLYTVPSPLKVTLTWSWSWWSWNWKKVVQFAIHVYSKNLCDSRMVTSTRVVGKLHVSTRGRRAEELQLSEMNLETNTPPTK